MSAAVFAKTLSDSRRSLIGWAVGTALVGMVYASTYPSQRQNTESIPEALRESLHVDGTAAGYLQATVFGVIVPLLAMIYGVAMGSRAIASDEESGQLDLLLAHPITRTRFALQRFGALVAGAFGIAALVWLAVLAVRSSAELTSVTPVELLAQCLNLALLAITFGALALGIGAAVGRRAVVLVVSAIAGVLAYTASTFATQIGADWLAYLSPFHYYIGGEPLKNGFQWGDGAVLVIASAVFVVAGVVRFNNRDVNS
ncbi:ABC transporter permease subunit [Streptomyces poonensis]|uniref:ABC transporter permease n=1 Tax=Streptomyces poonensis TaxID=68255 RepID=A0A918UMV9_9ACTN|nr:ABC transporter permease subunit [Streptomyces poonensis]GGZ21274.1 ABC transporter permease [Streptomyces poonensis]